METISIYGPKYPVSRTFLKWLSLLASCLEQTKLIDEFDPKILCWLFTGWRTVLFRAWFEASTEISSTQRSDLPTQCCHFKASQVSENSRALEATPPCSDLRCTLDVQHMINRWGTAGLGTLGGDGGMLKLAHCAVTLPGTQCQRCRLNKLTRDRAL